MWLKTKETVTPLSLPHLSSPLLITKMRCRWCSYGNMKASPQLYASFGAVMKPHCINTRSAKMLNCFLGSFIFWQSFNVANSPQLLQWQRVFRSGFDKYYVVFNYHHFYLLKAYYFYLPKIFDFICWKYLLFPKKYLLLQEVCSQIWATLYDYPGLKTCDGLIKYIKECVRTAWGLTAQVSMSF